MNSEINKVIIDKKANLSDVIKKININTYGICFVVDEKTLPKDFKVTHRSLFDNTIQGIKHKKLPIFSFQGHPEACPGPQDVNYLFENFINFMKKNINAKKK